MLKICKCYGDEFIPKVKDKKILIFGCGEIAKKTLDFYENQIENINIIAFVDNNKNLWNTNYTYKDKSYPIINVDNFCDIVKQDKEKNIVLLLAVSKYLGNILKQLDEIEVLNNIETYLANYLRIFNTKKDFDFPQGKSIIPKKIHYCWFGGNPIPKHLQDCIDTWRKFCPGYEIIRWDESNYDYTKNNYMKQAYETKKWGFVPDYARLDIIYNEGGIYLDTDVKLTKPLDKLLNTESFFISLLSGEVNLGLGFGAVIKNNLIKILRDDYNNHNFILEDGTLNLKTCNQYQSPILKSLGFKLENKFEILNNSAIYPSSIIVHGYNYYIEKMVNNNTIATHLADGSWASGSRKQPIILTKQQLQKHKEL